MFSILPIFIFIFWISLCGVLFMGMVTGGAMQLPVVGVFLGLSNFLMIFIHRDNVYLRNIYNTYKNIYDNNDVFIWILFLDDVNN